MVSWHGLGGWVRGEGGGGTGFFVFVFVGLFVVAQHWFDLNKILFKTK